MPLFRQVVECQPALPGRYRYRLRVRLGDGPALAIILKNPSLADGERLDPTVGKVEAWARRNGFGAVSYLNLFAYRSPYPAALEAVDYATAVGPENDAALLSAHQQADLVVVAWGNPNGIAVTRYACRIKEVLALLTNGAERPLFQVGDRTQAGYPRHGLHWNGEVSLRPFALVR
ncbi:MAG TPA: DUF1643 domain-containing protein [Caldilineaceae bacterium]|nr:DUF1643 domain-containing protein [Caldilineaceae bacterium]